MFKIALIVTVTMMTILGIDQAYYMCSHNVLLLCQEHTAYFTGALPSSAQGA